MSELRELYQEVILDHARRPRNFGALPAANRRAVGHNPLCGDHVEVALRIEDDVVRDVRFEGRGCAISTASASLMTEIVKGKRLDEVKAIFERFHFSVTSESDAELDLAALGKLAALAGVREFPLRVKCASLPWHTLQAAAGGEDTPVTTE